MELLKEGKTKDVYALEDGNILLQFKDDATVDEDGHLDPSYNKVGAKIEGLGLASLRVTKYYLNILFEVICGIRITFLSISPLIFMYSFL